MPGATRFALKQNLAGAHIQQQLRQSIAWPSAQQQRQDEQNNTAKRTHENPDRKICGTSSTLGGTGLQSLPGECGIFLRDPPEFQALSPKRPETN
jgi:molybdopterin biosynthesis enzyme MoaB